jgi:hypothetical protein
MKRIEWYISYILSAALAIYAIIVLSQTIGR